MQPKYSSNHDLARDLEDDAAERTIGALLRRPKEPVNPALVEGVKALREAERRAYCPYGCTQHLMSDAGRRKGWAFCPNHGAVVYVPVAVQS